MHAATIKTSYDDNDFDNFIEDKQHCYNGKEKNPEFTKFHGIRKNKKEKSFKEDLAKANFSPEVIAKADEVFSQINSGLKQGVIKRGVRRKQLMFFCVQTAYNLLRIPEDPVELAARCGITQSEMMKANSMCSPSKINYHVAPVKWNPVDYLTKYIKKIEDMEITTFSDEAVEEIKMICNEVTGKNLDLDEQKPQTIAAAVIVFYLSLHGYVIDKNEYDKIFSKSQMTITKIKTMVESCYNS